MLVVNFSMAKWSTFRLPLFFYIGPSGQLFGGHVVNFSFAKYRLLNFWLLGDLTAFVEKDSPLVGALRLRIEHQLGEAERFHRGKRQPARWSIKTF